MVVRHGEEGLVSQGTQRYDRMWKVVAGKAGLGGLWPGKSWSSSTFVLVAFYVMKAYNKRNAARVRLPDGVETSGLSRKPSNEQDAQTTPSSVSLSPEKARVASEGDARAILSVSRRP